MSEEISEDVNGNVTRYTYPASDGLDRLSNVAHPDGGSTAFAYVDTPGSLSVTTSVAQTSGTPITTVVSYDGLGRKSSTNVASGQIVTTYAYDARGRLAYTSLPSLGFPTAECLLADGTVQPIGCAPAYGTLTQFDGIGRPAAVIEAGGATTTSQYTANQTLVTDPSGAARLSTADRDGNLISVVEDPTGLNYNTTYTYDPLNNLTAVAQGTRPRSFAYDASNRLVEAVNPESGTIRYS